MKPTIKLKQPPLQINSHSRYNFSPANAALFKDIFLAMKDGKDRFISAQVTGYKVSTLQLKTGDALRFLARSEGGWYKELHDTISLRAMPEGVLLTFTQARLRKPPSKITATVVK